jgi:DNA-binding HxlR family transcriptional regulator/putative sterol carrier protein
MATMSRKGFGQICGLARALEIVGERWALLIVRDLVAGPKRFTDLRRGLPRIPTNVLSSRLKELERDGIVRRRTLPPPAASAVYELTEYGLELDEVMLRLGLWGARSLGPPEEGAVMTADGMMMAMRATFRPEAAEGLDAVYELRLGDVTLHAAVDEGRVVTASGPAEDPDVVLETSPADLAALLSGELEPKEAVAAGRLRARGEPALLAPFAELFRIGPALSAEPPGR